MAQCEECIHIRVCAEVNGLKCRPDFIWYDAKFGCPYYSAGVEPRAVVDLYKQLNSELEDELAITHNRLEDARRELAMEIFDDIVKVLFEKQRQYENSHQGGKARQMMLVRFEVYKLRKKYTGEPQ